MTLIDVDSLYNALSNKLTWLMGYGSDVYLGVVDDIKDVIENQPTAYDIDKVVKKLEAIKGYACYGMNCDECKYTHDCFEGEKSQEKAIDEAIEIVKHGGIFDDVCKYKIKDKVIYASCNNKQIASAFCWFNECGDYKYCPY